VNYTNKYKEILLCTWMTFVSRMKQKYQSRSITQICFDFKLAMVLFNIYFSAPLPIFEVVWQVVMQSLFTKCELFGFCVCVCVCVCARAHACMCDSQLLQHLILFAPDWNSLCLCKRGEINIIIQLQIVKQTQEYSG